MASLPYPRRLDIALTPTPIQFLPRLSAELGARIWFKRDDLTGSLLSGNKIRKLEFALAEAIDQGCDTIITAGGIQSNHCRATALACAQLGLKCHLVLRGRSHGHPDGNLLLDQLAGATFSFFPEEVYSTDKPAIVADLTAELARRGQKAYFIPVGASNAIGSWGYVRAWDEIRDQSATMGVTFQHIVSAVGSGGTTAGLIAGRACDKSTGTLPQVWGVNVCDDADYFQRDIQVILDELRHRFNLPLTPDNAPIQILDGYVGKGYAIPYDEEIALIKHLGKLEGQILDPVYTGKGLYGLIQQQKLGRFGENTNILFVHTGGIFGLFPQKELFGMNEQSA